MPFSLVIPALVRPLTIEALLTWFPEAARAMDRMESQFVALQANIARAGSLGIVVPSNVRQASAEGKTAQVEARSRLEFIRTKLRTAAGYAKRFGMVNDGQIKQAGLGFAFAAVIPWALKALGVTALVLGAAAAFMSAYSTMTARTTIMDAWSNQVAAQQAANPGAPLPPIPNVPAGPPGWLESNINAAGNAVQRSTAPLLMLGLFAAFYLFSKQKKEKTERRAA